ncbi:Fis family transcriptional regulator [Gordonia desulfuricans]|uniref:Fis family transcriptional regulator n=1 Tax=Gordonia desulfuricans TaxID=89051 RepID=A0A7K3LNC1_9ACTN|nr:helix-turn-helix domain-containing protein [Gordonia desulfuricans]NDK89752.1 Fis family transcriptional regulator [Gordonia desulfuricans]
MTDLRERQLRIAAARADFLEYGPAGAAGVDDVVAASWERSHDAGVNADRYHVDYHDDIDFDSRLARCAQPVIERLTEDMSDVPVTIALTDAKARIVDRRDCSAAVGRVLDRVDFQRGFCFVESGVGTNGVGTVFEVGAPVRVIGCEHFNQKLIQFACTGAPVFDPVSGRVVGVLDASMLADTWNPLMDALIRSAAGEIGRNLLLDRSQATRALFETYLRADARPHQPVMAVGSGTHGMRGADTTMVNEAARELLSPDQQNTVAEFAQFLMTRSERAARHLTLDDGRRIRLRSTGITCNGDTVGMVLLLDEDEIVIPGSTAPLSIPDISAPESKRERDTRSAATTRSPAWRTARAEAVEAFESGDGLLALGEPGSGRLSLIAEAFREVHGDTPVVVVDAPRLGRGEQVVSPDPTVDGPALLVVRRPDQVGTDTAATLCGMVDDALTAGYRVAVTMGSGDTAADSPAAVLLDRLDRSVTVPPLRLRSADLESIVAQIVKDVSPQRITRLSPKAMRVIASYGWPGNITQLRQALSEALRRRPVGEIQPEDLPGFCRSNTTRTLTTLESAERDAIVAALTEYDGNRVRAAAALGLSRSSLYRKMHSYSISGV